MKKVKLIIVAVAMLSLASSSAVYADGFAPGEGLYLGAFGGSDMGIVQAKVVTNGETKDGCGAACTQTHAGGEFEQVDGGLGLNGATGGIMVGYGYRMGDLYAGLEGEHSWGDVKFKFKSSIPVELAGGGSEGGGKKGINGTNGDPTHTVDSIEATKEWTGGLFGRLGFYVNQDTLLAFKGGVLVSKFEAKVNGTPSYSEAYYGGGPSFGASLTSRVTSIDPNLSVRIGAVYTDYLTAAIYGIGGKVQENITSRSGHNSELTGAALSARIGIQYSFFDANTLF